MATQSSQWPLLRPMFMKRKKQLSLFALSLATGMGLSSLIHFLAMKFSSLLPLILLYNLLTGLLAALLFPVMLLLLIAVPAWLLVRHKGWKVAQGRSSIFLGGLGLVLMHLYAAFTTTLWIGESQSMQAEAFCENLIPQLEAYKAKQGRYPQSLEALQMPERLPYYLGEASQFYTGTQASYEFTYSVPWIISPGYTFYDSQTGEWSYVD